MTRNKTIRETLEHYYSKDIPIHIELYSGKWFNGKIVQVHEDRFLFNEEKFGEMLILFERIKDDGINPRQSKEA